MPILFNDDSNVSLQLNLVNNEHTDYETANPEYMRWIPFELTLNVNDEIIAYYPEVITTLSHQELKLLIAKFEEIIEMKNLFVQFEDFEYISHEQLFEVKISDTKEEGLINFEWWFNMGCLTNGVIFGFSKGFRFIVPLEIFVKFTDELDEQLNKFIEQIEKD